MGFLCLGSQVNESAHEMTARSWMTLQVPVIVNCSMTNMVAFQQNIVLHAHSTTF